MQLNQNNDTLEGGSKGVLLSSPLDDQGGIYMQKVGTAAVGSIIKLRHNNTPRDFIVVHQGKPSQIYDDSCIGTWVLMKDVYENRKRNETCINDYANCDLHEYLNSIWLDMFDTTVKQSVKQVKIPYRPGSGTSTEIRDGASGLSCSVFLLSGYEIGWTLTEKPYLAADGAKLEYFLAGAGEPANMKRIGYLNGTAHAWWLRTPYVGGPTHAWGVRENGDSNTNGCYVPWGVRPALILSTDAYFHDDGTLSTNAPPNSPPHITVSENARINKPVTVTWGAASDPDGDSVTYELERSVNAAAYIKIQSSPALSNTETVGADWYTVQYRVRSCDAYGSYSGYTVSPALPVVHNVDPTISGQDTDLGNVTAPPSYTYQVNDTDEADSLTITELLDGRTHRTITNAARNTSYTFAIGMEQYIQLRPGQHQLTVTVADNNGNSASRNITFTRVVEAIDFELRPRETDALAEKVLVSMRYIGDPNRLQMQVCNNPFDAAPVWEDASPGQKHLFVNTACVSGKPGIGLRVKLEPSEDFPEVACFAPSIAYL